MEERRRSTSMGTKLVSLRMCEKATLFRGWLFSFVQHIYMQIVAFRDNIFVEIFCFALLYKGVRHFRLTVTWRVYGHP